MLSSHTHGQQGPHYLLIQRCRIIYVIWKVYVFISHIPEPHLGVFRNLPSMNKSVSLPLTHTAATAPQFRTEKKLDLIKFPPDAGSTKVLLTDDDVYGEGRFASAARVDSSVGLIVHDGCCRWMFPFSQRSRTESAAASRLPVHRWKDRPESFHANTLSSSNNPSLQSVDPPLGLSLLVIPCDWGGSHTRAVHAVWQLIVLLYWKKCHKNKVIVTEGVAKGSILPCFWCI